MSSEPGAGQTDALRRIELLDCEKKTFDPFLEFRTKEHSLRPMSEAPPRDETSVDLVSCDPEVEPLVSMAKWRPTFEKANIDDETYIKSLAGVLGDLLCEGKDVVKNVAAKAKLMSELEKRHLSRFSAGGLTTPWSHPEIGSIHILRGLLKNGRFEATGAEASALAERILNKECPVSATLTEDDKASLRAFQNAVEQPRAEK